MRSGGGREPLTCGFVTPITAKKDLFITLLESPCSSTAGSLRRSAVHRGLRRNEVAGRDSVAAAWHPRRMDPNPLLSTTASAAAALVAIVGGLLVSRVISLATERSGLQQRLADLQARLRATESRTDGLQERLLLGMSMRSCGRAAPIWPSAVKASTSQQ